MKNLLFVISIVFLIASCKGEKVSHSSPPKMEQKTNKDATNSVTKSPAVRDGNVIRQKVTVGGEQNQTANIDAVTALKLLKLNPEMKVLDVRTPNEVAEGIYPNALHIDIYGPDFEKEINKLNKEESYIVYCKSGGRSGKAVSKMRALGFTKSYNMIDGYAGFTTASKN